eukprot:m.286408 g.286408  ORF g.286408 m.286408 type:complete len:80 (-) comp16209_c0_seq2:75-314(-)
MTTRKGRASASSVIPAATSASLSSAVTTGMSPSCGAPAVTTSPGDAMFSQTRCRGDTEVNQRVKSVETCYGSYKEFCCS